MADDKYKSAGNIRSKITSFDFEDTAKSNLAMAKQVGDVASVIEKKSDEQNRRFDKLLKVLEFIPKDVLEQRKQQKALFTELAKTVATLEKEAKASINNRPKYFELRAQADKLREQGRTLSPDHDPSKVRNVKEFGYKLLGLNVQQAREEGIGSAIGSTAFPTFKAIGKALSGKNSFDRQVEQEKLYPEATQKRKETMTEARLKGGIEYTDEKGITSGKERSGGGGGDSIGGVVLRRIADAVVEIRNHIVGKKGREAPDTNTPDEPPKSMFTPEEADKNDPRNYGVKTKGKQKGRKYWKKRSKYGNRRFLKPGEEDKEPEIQEPEVLGLHTGIELTEEQKARAAGNFDDKPRHDPNHADHYKEGWKQPSGHDESQSKKPVASTEKHDEPQSKKPVASTEKHDEPQPKYAESGIEAEPTVTGSMVGGAEDAGEEGGIAVMAILAAITEALPIFIAIGAGIAVIGLAVDAIHQILDHDWGGKEMAKSKAQDQTHQADERKQLEAEAAAKHMTVEQMLNDNASKGSAGAKIALKRYEEQKTGETTPMDAIKPDATSVVIPKDKIQPTTPATGDILEKAPANAPPMVVAPITNNVVNNTSGGGGSSGSSDSGMPSVRTPDRAYQRWQEKRQNRIF
jgi:hypothetical protein